ncbi:nucleotidyltransferase domain-containing protein [candidate division CSSED10-310 bacterium]|uniref:Nucleotidyltransferase domain-containing protein n=1 Tax=candidate division CSSED10-310 bacterium TaxID=2855610 RepID=A0ABV6YYU9_UNCC1
MMSKDGGEASQWRIDYARELAQFYITHPQIKMIVLGGSPSRGLSDQYSDLDIVVYWDKMDHEWLELIPLRDTAAERKLMRKMGESDIYLEQYYFGNLKADFGHVTLDFWQEMCDDVLQKFDTDSGKQKSIAGFMEAVPLHGENLIAEWKKRLSSYPDQLAYNMVKQNLSLFVHGCLLRQGYERGDLIFYYDGLCLMLKKLLAILAGLNRMYFSKDEPRWIEFELEQMVLKPDQMWQRILKIFRSPPAESDYQLNKLVDEVLDLVAEHMPDVSVIVKERIREFEVKPCPEKPPIHEFPRPHRD